MTLPRFRSMVAYWKNDPPTHIAMSTILTALAGGPPKPSPTPTPNEEAKFIPQHVPVDDRGNPTKDIPMTLDQAAKAMGGVIRRKDQRRG